MADTPRTRSALQTLLADNSTGAISAQDVRDFLVSVYLPNTYPVTNYGAAGDGVTDDTTAIEDTFTAAGSNGLVYFPPGTYLYSGDGIDAGQYNIMGAGWAESVISLSSGKYLMAPSSIVNQGWIRGLKFLNGAGAFKQTYTGVNGGRGITWENVWFKSYTTCAVGTLSSDYPFMRFRSCIFDGTSGTSIGVALKGDNSSGYVDGCFFQRNRYHLKLGNAGQAFRVLNCDFLRYDAYVATARVDIWLVPGVTGTNGVNVNQCKFGNENLNASDYRILCADEDTAVTDFTDTPHSASTSSAAIRTLQISNNFAQGVTSGPALVYTTVDDWDLCVVGPNRFVTPPSYVVEFLNPTAKTTTLTWFAGNVKGSGLMTFSNRSVTSL